GPAFLAALLVAAPASAAPVARTVTVGSNPSDVAVSNVYGAAYVVNDGSLSLLSLTTHREVAEIPTGFHDQTAVGVAASGRKAYVGTFDLDTLAVVDTAHRAVSGHIRVGFGATAIVTATTPKGEFAYTTLLGAQRVAVVRTSDDVRVRSIALPAAPETATTT